MAVAKVGVSCALVLLAVFTALNLFAEGEKEDSDDDYDPNE